MGRMRGRRRGKEGKVVRGKEGKVMRPVREILGKERVGDTKEKVTRVRRFEGREGREGRVVNGKVGSVIHSRV